MSHRIRAGSNKQAQGPPNRRQPFPAIPDSLTLPISIAEAYRPMADPRARSAALAVGIVPNQASALPTALAELKALNGRVSIGA